jgi:hypothetical protein
MAFNNLATVLDNAGKGTPERFAALSDAFDLETMRHLKDRGITQGWRCLEVGRVADPSPLGSRLASVLAGALSSRIATLVIWNP